ncbi:MAG: sodium:proton antiporter [Candidatus Accumulibacter phosphatis]|uniref:Sodium:proton antiporter n=1 Tax=Candidatus Accumulibacter phosphatis TaxID=327160 RepID=A0A6A7RT39_9PROT|nr:sodium:proton antiporter [Candidatus Accumulibacter phosphatis]
MQLLPRVLLAVMAALSPMAAFASGGVASTALDLTSHWAGFAALAVFFLAYGLVIAEETLHLRKSKPVMVAAGIIWVLVAIVYAQNGDTHTAEIAVRHNLLEFAELFLFLLAAMTYINVMDERGVFDLLRVKLVSQGFSLRTIFWITGALAFMISPVADNLTTALLMATVASAVGGSNKKFVGVACINIVIAANAGGAFSPFGDITTLMVWQKGLVQFGEFFRLFLPSVVNWLVPAAIMSLAIGNSSPDPVKEKAVLQHGAWVIVGLFLGTIVMAVCAHNFLHLPPVMGMMTGLGVLKFYGYYLKRRAHFSDRPAGELLGDTALAMEPAVPSEPAHGSAAGQYNIFKALERAEWDTLMFFYGVILCVGGLGTMGYLSLGSELMYGQLGATTANILVGFLSAVVDNIPVMFAVLAMQPDMDLGQWLLVTLTAGVGGSLLSVGSAAGVAVMGQARGVYTFFSHLKWSWAILLGYAASIWTHFLVNAKAFT